MQFCISLQTDGFACHLPTSAARDQLAVVQVARVPAALVTASELI
jgi:hypothetical protein